MMEPHIILHVTLHAKFSITVCRIVFYSVDFDNAEQALISLSSQQILRALGLLSPPWAKSPLP